MFCCYKALARLGQRVLNPNGCIYVETYHNFHDELISIFTEYDYSEVNSVQDLNGKLRFVAATKR